MSRSRSSIKALAIAAGVLVVVLLFAEIGVRATGVIDFPLYHADDVIGYIPEPNQQGSFLHKNTWILNDKSQGTTRWAPNGNRDLLLLGDSLVWGGNMLRQEEKLGPLLEKKLPGWRVWPASAGSWSIANEVTYLDLHPDVESEADVIVWVVNTGDLDRPSRWSSEETHPRTRPISALVYAFKKYALPWISGKLRAAPPPDPAAAPPSMPALLPETEAALHARITKLRAEYPGRKILFVLYADQSQLPPDAEADEAFYRKFRDHLRSNLDASIDIVEVRDDPRWKRALYRDGIHPSGAGDDVLAEIILEHLNLAPASQ